MDAQKWARGLGWFSIGLGVTELIAARAMARTLGTKNEALVRAFGVREIAAGVGLLFGAKKGPWIWARIAGDALDVAALSASALRRKGDVRRNAIVAMAVVSPVVAADVVLGRALGMAQ